MDLPVAGELFRDGHGADHDLPVRYRDVAVLALPPPPMFVPAQLRPLLEVSRDGHSFTPVTEFPASASPQNTISFAPVEARSVRIRFEKNPHGAFKLPSSSAPGAAPSFDLSMLAKAAPVIRVLEAAFYGEARVHRRRRRLRPQ